MAENSVRLVSDNAKVRSITTSAKQSKAHIQKEDRRNYYIVKLNNNVLIMNKCEYLKVDAQLPKKG